MFKVGDKVRCVSNLSGLAIGNIYEINKIMGQYIRFSEDGHEHYGDRFELVTSDIDALIKKANEGYDAMRSLYKDHTGEFKFLENGIDIVNEFLDDRYADVRVEKIEVPKFESFIVGSNWKVELDGDKLKVGCQYFKAGQLKHSLTVLCKEGRPLSTKPEFVLESNRTGITCNSNFISWEDADKILTALVKAGV